MAFSGLYLAIGFYWLVGLNVRLAWTTAFVYFAYHARAPPCLSVPHFCPSGRFFFPHLGTLTPRAFCTFANMFRPYPFPEKFPFSRPHTPCPRSHFAAYPLLADWLRRRTRNDFFPALFFFFGSFFAFFMSYRSSP